MKYSTDGFIVSLSFNHNFIISARKLVKTNFSCNGCFHLSLQLHDLCCSLVVALFQERSDLTSHCGVSTLVRLVGRLVVTLTKFFRFQHFHPNPKRVSGYPGQLRLVDPKFPPKKTQITPDMAQYILRPLSSLHLTCHLFISLQLFIS